MVFDGFDANGDPVGKPFMTPHIQITAVSEAQTDNTMSLVVEMLGQGPAADEYYIDIGKTRILTDHGKIEPVTANAKSREGQRPTFAVLDEAFALDTMIPTPTGWSTVSSLRVGDQVIGSDGKPANVMRLTDTMEDRDCFRATFPDKTDVVTSAGHLWWTKTGKTVGVLTTQQIYDSKTPVYIPGCPEVEFSEKDLPIDPYVLGVWLGDGNSYHASVTCGSEDFENLTDNLAQRCDVTVRSYSKNSNFTLAIHGLGAKHKSGMFIKARLRDLGLIANKHIPQIYLRASVDQRYDLLAGLMDTGGSVHANGTGQACYAGTNRSLVLAVAELVRSLGVKATFTETKNVNGPVYWVYFIANERCFKLRSKSARCGPSRPHKWQRIKMEKTESVPVRCITIDRDDHILLVGEGFKPSRQTHLWVPSNHGDQLAATVRRNLGKIDGRSIETTNAFVPGEGSVAEDSYSYWKDIQAGVIKDDDMLYDSRQAPDDTPYKGEGRRAGLVEAYGSSCTENGGWVKLDRIEREMDDPATSENDGRRFYFNQIVQGYSQWMDPQKWAERGQFSHVARNEKIALGFDGSIRNDSTALVGCRLEDGFIWPIAVWEKPSNAGDDWEVPFLVVDAVVRKTMDEYNVVWVYADPAYWQDIVGRWSLDYEDKVFEFWTHRRALMCKEVERFETAVLTGQVSFSSDPEHEVLSRHVLNTHADDTPSGKLIRKEFPQSARKIDAAMAAVLAFAARAAAIADGRMEDTDDDKIIYSF